MRSGMAYPTLRIPTVKLPEGRQDAAIIIAIEDYTRLADRAHAQEIAAAWYRYFRDTRRIRPWRISLLRNSEATVKSIHAALEDAHEAVGRRGTVWFVFIGHVGGAAPGKYGALWLREGDGTKGTLREQAFSAEEVLSRLGYGMQPRTVAVFDGCLAGHGRTSGTLRSGTETPELPRPPAEPPPEIPVEYSYVPSTWQGELALAQIKTQIDAVRGRGEPVDVAVFSAGHGPGCVEDLPGTHFPALSYLLLGGLRGWADRNGNGSVSASELITQTTEMLRAAHYGLAGPTPAPSSYSADFTITRRIAEQAPDLRGLLPPEIARTYPVAVLLKEPVLWSRDPMVRLEGGRYRMGCPSRGDTDCETDELPSHAVYVSRFQLDPFEVSQSDYAACVANGACEPVDLDRCYVWTGEHFMQQAAIPVPLTHPQHPMVCVNWYQAQRFCAAHGRRLPTEAEWERAAAGTTRRRFPWGDAKPDCTRAHFDGCGEHTRPIGERPAGATPEGVYDLAGNASEWVHDWYARDIYKMFRDRDPIGAQAGLVRGVRGGSYYDAPETLRSAYRYALNPISSFSTVGFRCAR